MEQSFPAHDCRLVKLRTYGGAAGLLVMLHSQVGCCSECPEQPTAPIPMCDDSMSPPTELVHDLLRALVESSVFDEWRSDESGVGVPIVIENVELSGIDLRRNGLQIPAYSNFDRFRDQSHFFVFNLHVDGATASARFRFDHAGLSGRVEFQRLNTLDQWRVSNLDARKAR